MNYDEAIKVSSSWFDHTNDLPTDPRPDEPTGYATRLTGGSTDAVYGLAKTLSVMPGDVISLEVYAKYVDVESANWSDALRTLLTSISQGTYPAGTFVDGGVAGSLGNTAFPYPGVLVRENDNGTGPKAYLNYLIFDRNYNFIDGGFKRLSSTPKESGTNVRHELLSFKDNEKITVSEAGYVYVYLSNENDTPVEVYFDDFKVSHTKKTSIVQSDNYYPFGLAFNSYQRQNATKNNYTYNGKELQDELDLGWMDYGARMYMPEIGRWGVNDPHADSYHSFSPYNYAINNPVNVIDPDGNDIYLLTWFSKNDETGHAGIAIDNYKTQNKKDAKGNDVLDANGNVVTEQVKDGTFTYYDLWPSDGVGKDEGQDNVTADYSKGVQIKSLADLMSKDPTGQRSGNVGAEGRAADGIVKVTSTATQDATAKATAEKDINATKAYNGCYNNCSTFAQRVLNSALPNKIDASQPIRPEKALQGWPFNYKDAQTVAPNNLYNAALQIKGATNIKGPKSVQAKPYLEYMGQRNRP